MTRVSSILAIVGATLAMTCVAATAQPAAPKADAAKGKTAAVTAAKPSASTAASRKAEKEKGKSESQGGDKPTHVDTFGAWGVYTAASGRAKTCYALGKPTDLKRDKAYLFVSTRPAESVRNEVSIVMGFDVKADATPTAQIGSTSFDMVAKGANLWVKNPADEKRFVEALRKGGRLIVKAPSTRGSLIADSYALSGLAQALELVQKNCP